MGNLELLKEMNAVGMSLIVLAIGLVIFGLILFRNWSRRRQHSGVIIYKKEAIAEEKKETPILGVGKFPCFVLRNGFLEETRIAEPIGAVWVADASLPVSGSVYLVSETEDGQVVPYDPRQYEFESARSPEFAYFATHWEIVTKVYGNILAWWQSAPLWITIAVLVLVFLAMLVFSG